MEDNAINAKVAEAMLRAVGANMDIVGDGKAAVELASRNEYDCILLDIRMPVMDGVTAAIKIRELKNDKRLVPIIAVTASVLGHEVQKYLKSGCNDVLKKPYTSQELYAVLMKYCTRSSMATPRVSDCLLDRGAC